MLRRHRRAFRGSESCASDSRTRHGADLRVRRHWHPPNVLPLSIGDGELAETADAVVPLPEIFSYWLQAGRIDVGFLGAAQIDRFGNLNTTVIGGYGKPKTRLPGAGGAPEIAHHAKQIFVVLKQSPRSFVAKLDFCTSAGFLNGNGERARRAMPGAGPQAVITDLGVLASDRVAGAHSSRPL